MESKETSTLSMNDPEVLRDVLLYHAAQEKLRKCNRDINEGIETTFQQWEQAVMHYVDCSNVLHDLLDACTKEIRAQKIREMIKRSASEIAGLIGRYESMCSIINSLTSQRENLTKETMQILGNQIDRVERMIDYLNKYVAHKDDRKAGKLIHKFKLKLAELLQKIKSQIIEIPLLMKKSIRQSSNIVQGKYGENCD